LTKDFIRIAHLSDLHFSSLNQRSYCYSAIRTDLASQKPDVILITGDIADNLGGIDLRMSLWQAKEFLVSTFKAIGCDPANRLFVVPGNHDYRFKGLLGFGSAYPDIFNEVFGQFYQTRYICELGIIVGCFDSNTTNYNINFASGEVLMNEFDKFRNNLDTLKADLGEKYEIVTKIALLHHHPMPIWRAEIQSGILGGIIDREEFLLLRNAGTFMKEMIKAGVRLIFHGHKHFRGLSKASFPAGSDLFKSIGIISAGSAGKRTDNEYSYNIVDLFNDGHVLVDFRILRGEGAYESERQPFELISMDEGRGRHFQDILSIAPTVAKKIIHSSTISWPSGDFESLTLIDGWVAKQQPCNKLNMDMKSAGGLFRENPITFNVIYPPNQKMRWQANGPPEDGLQRGFIVFEPPISIQPICTEIYTNIPNAFEFNKQDRKALSGDSEVESLGKNTNYILPEQLILNIQFPKEFIPINPRVIVKDLGENLQQKEVDYCYDRLNNFKLSNSLSLNVNYPDLMQNYVIQWDLPEQSEMIPKIETSKIAKAEDIKKHLGSLQPGNSDEGSIRKSLENIYTEILKIQYLKTDSEGEPLEICLIVYDEVLKRLRYAAYFCPRCPKLSESNVWNLRIASGQCAAGRAWKRKETALELYPRRISDIEAQYIRKPACPSSENESLKAIITIPLTFPIKSDYILALFELASCSNNSLLLKLGDGSSEDQKAKKGALIDTVKTNFFANYILPAVGVTI
jgi:hypothetical protein